MSTIKISELNPAGSSFFADSDSYLNELTTETEIDAVKGGATPTVTVVSIAFSVAVFWRPAPSRRPVYGSRPRR
jgi:hypothetical protein